MNIKWNTEYRQLREQREQSAGWWKLNLFFVYILWAAILFGLFSILLLFVEKVEWTAFMIVPVALRLIVVVGCYLILCLNRWGFYMAFGSLVLNVILSFIALLLGKVVASDVIIGLLQIVFLLGNMLMTNKCERNAYDVLWDDDDE